jgi:hypothetical protein
MLAFFFVFAACSASWGLFGSWHLGVVEIARSAAAWPRGGPGGLCDCDHHHGRRRPPRGQSDESLCV